MRQLIFVLEANSSSRTDYFYVKKCLDSVYGERAFKLTSIYAGCKSKLFQQEKRILDFERRYEGKTNVVVVSDIDENDELQNQKLVDYCKRNSFKLVWMNLDIEDVFWGKKVKKNEKEALARKYLGCYERMIQEAKLRNADPFSERHSSNLLTIIDSCLKEI